jgi:hypothetical protein
MTSKIKGTQTMYNKDTGLFSAWYQLSNNEIVRVGEYVDIEIAHEDIERAVYAL